VQVTIGFIRVPKTASTRLTLKLKNVTVFTPVDVCNWWHLPASQMIQQHDHPHDWVAGVRNPMQTYISFYWMYKRGIAERETLIAEGKEVRPLPLPNQPQYQSNLDILTSDAPVEEWLATCYPDQMFAYYFAGVDPTDFAYLSVMEEMDTSDALFDVMYGCWPVLGFNGNINPDRMEPELTPYVVDYSEADFMNRCPGDYDMYQRALTRFADLRNQYEV
jgi:hypothetical protein